MKKLWWLGIALAVSVVLNSIAVKVGRGSYGHIMFVLHVMLFVGLPAFVASLILMIVGREKRWNLFLAGYALNLVSLVVGLMVVSAFVGLFVADRDVKDAKAWCDQLSERIEVFREQNGRIPDRIEQVSGGERLPGLLRDAQFYIPRAQSYTLEFRNPSKSMTFIVYDAATGTWQERK